MIPPDLSIEYPFIKLPYDCSVKCTTKLFSFILKNLIIEFKQSRKHTEKEMSSVLN
jgi:hypothetical protein